MNSSVPPSASSEPPIVAQFVCGRCGAFCDAEQVKCWMCKADLPGIESRSSENPYASDSHLQSSVVGPQPGPSGTWQYEWIFSVLLIGCLILAILIGIGMAAEDPGMLVAYLILVGPAFVVTGVRALWQFGETGSPRPRSLLISLFVSFSITIAILSVLTIAAVILLFSMCFWQFSN